MIPVYCVISYVLYFKSQCYVWRFKLFQLNSVHIYGQKLAFIKREFHERNIIELL